MSVPPPLIAVPCDRRMAGGHPFQQVGEKYLLALRDGAGGLPLLVPAFEPPLNPDDLIRLADGFLFTGSPSNVDPGHYGGPAPRPGNLADPHRDAITLPLIRAALAAGKPCLFICRGHQELNVALGGTLFQHVHEEPGRLDHRDDDKDGVEVKYGPAHDVSVVAGGKLAGLLGSERFRVNSLHSQAIDRLAGGLSIEAVADDGTIEAVSVSGAGNFAFSFQWHPEWRWQDNAQSRAIFAAFGRSLRGDTA